MAEAAHTTIKYDGPALADHAMDVAHLAPALLALSDLVKEANRYANGDRAGVKVLVRADLEQKCFELDVQLVMTIWEQAKLLIADDNVRSAKEIAEWLGIVGGSFFGLFQLIKWLRGQKVTSVTVVKVADGRNLVEIRVEGDEEPVEVAEAVYELYANMTTRQKAIAVLEPLREPGYETLEFYDDRSPDKAPFVHFDKDDVPEKDGSDLPEVVPQNERKSTIRTSVKIRKPAYEGRSKWTLMYKRAVDAAMDDEAWLTDFQGGKVSAPPGSYLEVDLEEIYITNENDEMIGDPVYRVKKVHGVTFPPKQRTLFREDDDGDDNPERGSWA